MFKQINNLISWLKPISSVNKSNLKQNILTSTTSIKNKKSIDSNKTSASNISKKPDCLKHFHGNGKHFIWLEPCEEPCYKFLNPIKVFSTKIQIPNIAQESSSIYRKKYLDKHLETKYHRQCEKAVRLSTLLILNAGKSSPIGQAILKSKSDLANKIGSSLIYVYEDAKKLTLSAQTHPIRVVNKHDCK